MLTGEIRTFHGPDVLWYDPNVNAWRKLWYWLFPDARSPDAQCRACGERRAKQTMLHSGLNWFCDEKCEMEQTKAMIW